MYASNGRFEAGEITGRLAPPRSLALGHRIQKEGPKPLTRSPGPVRDVSASSGAAEENQVDGGICQ